MKEALSSVFRKKFNRNFLRDLKLEKDKITFTTTIYPKELIPYVIYGTYKGKVLIFPILFQNTTAIYYYYSIQFGKRPISYIHFTKEKLFIADNNCRL